MSADIVERLRRMAGRVADGTPAGFSEQAMLEGAAAEIARLRAEVEALRALLGDDGARGLGDRGA